MSEGSYIDSLGRVYVVAGGWSVSTPPTKLNSGCGRSK